MKACKVAELGHHTPRDFRDAFASRLLTAGVQLGHGDVAVTARHYARWVARDVYRKPLEVGEGEVPADLLVRIAALSPAESAPADGAL